MEKVRVYVRFRAQEKGDLARWTLTPGSCEFDSKPHVFAFDRVFPSDASQLEVFEDTAKPLISEL